MLPICIEYANMTHRYNNTSQHMKIISSAFSFGFTPLCHLIERVSELLKYHLDPAFVEEYYHGISVKTLFLLKYVAQGIFGVNVPAKVRKNKDM